MVHCLAPQHVLLGISLLSGLIFAPLEGAAQVSQDDILSLVIAPATTDNPRNSESDIIELRDGRLLLGWTEFYAGGGADDSAARIVGRISSDGGRTWGEKYTLVENDGKCNVMEVNFLRLLDGRIALFHLQKNVEVGGTETPDCRVMMRTSADEGRTFGPAKELTGEKRYIETASGRALRLGTGRILVECDDMGTAFCLISDDDGATWREGEHVKPAGGGCWEPAAIELKDGRVMMLMRTQLGCQYKSISEDGGETWSEPVPTPLRGTAAPVSLSRIPTTGDILAIWNHNPGARTRNPLTSAVSRNEGKTWGHFRDLENAPGDGWAYPSVTWVGDRALVTYFNYAGGISLHLKALPATWFYE